MEYPERYELVFQAFLVEDDVVVVRRTEKAGAGGYPIYEDDTGIVRAEISDRREVRMVASGGHQVPRTPLTARPLNS
jgi:predicted ABC-type ATPase